MKRRPNRTSDLSALTPTLLAETATAPVSVARCYGYQLRDAHGCHGSDLTGYLSSTTPHPWQHLAQARTRVHARLKSAEEARTLAARTAAGPEPVFDTTFTGPRAAFEKAHTAWKRRRDRAHQAASAPTVADLWAAEGYELVDTSHVEAANSSYRSDGDAGALLVLGHEVSRGCRCGHSGTVLLDPDWADDDEQHLFDPQPLTRIDAGEWRWWAAPELLDRPDPVAAAQDLLRTLAHQWQQAIDTNAAERATTQAIVDAAPSDDALARMRPVEYRAALEQRKAADRARWKLRHQTRSVGEILDGVCRREIRAVPVVAGFGSRNDYGWRQGSYKTVAELICGTADTGTGRGD